MIFRTLRHRIAAVFIGLLVLVMALVLGLVTRSNHGIVATELGRELSAGTRVFTRLIEQNQHQLETAATVLSFDFGFREAIATQDRPTIRSVLRNHGFRIGAQVMMVVTPEGRVVAETTPNKPAMRPFPFPDLLRSAEAAGKSAAFKVMDDGHLYQTVLVPIMAPKLIAWVAMGFPVDDAWARDLAQMTGLSVSVVRADQPAVTLLASSLEGARRAALPGALAQFRQNGMEQLVIALAGERFQTLATPLGGTASVILQRSLEQAEAPFHSMQMALFSIMLGGILLFALGSVLFARHIAGPVNRLATEAQRIEAGDYAQPIPYLAADEIGQLAASFNHMREGIAAREQKILKLAYTDTLTGLPNRTYFLEAFEKLPKDSWAAIAVLDLDRFALINNALGHPIGDRLLAEVGARLARPFTQPVLAARLWGDEFAFLLENADEAAAAEFAAALIGVLRQPIPLDDQRLDVDGSIGIALYPQDGGDATTLLRRAELAMSAAKRKHSGYAFVAEIKDEPPHEQLSLIGNMRDALARREFVVYYQPKLDLATGRICGAEALIRWQHPEMGLVPPMRFIPFAEQTGFIREITPWLLDHVAAQAAQWRREGIAIVLSINLSTHDLLNPCLVDQMRGLLDLPDLPPEALCLEITESALMEDPALALANLSELAGLGLKLSIDDFGTGQASLSYLKRLPVHELKIDQSFVTSVCDSPKDAAIVDSTILLGHALGLSIVAEGAETPADLTWLRDHRCDIAQGYGIARPMPGEQLPAWIAAYRSPLAE
ncbi:MAG: EAL domain-containing protein [Sulfuricella sp.]|nr:EAL domain-containing protein [Sulfuricella sp.]